jgi:hypothetical protein
VLNSRAEMREKLTTITKEALSLFDPKSPELAIACFANVMGLGQPRDPDPSNTKLGSFKYTNMQLKKP